MFAVPCLSHLFCQCQTNFDPVVNCSASMSQQVCVPVLLHRAPNTAADASGTAWQMNL